MATAKHDPTRKSVQDSLVDVVKQYRNTASYRETVLMSAQPRYSGGYATSTSISWTTGTGVSEYDDGIPRSTAPTTPTKRNKPMATTKKLTPLALERRRAGQARWYDLVPGDVIENNKGTVLEILDNNKYRVAKQGQDMGLMAGQEGYYSAESRPLTTDNWEMTNDALGSAKASAKSKVSFSSVILPEHKKAAIVDAIAQVDNHDLIFDTWGFGDVFEKGTAISMLFYGPPGTGKTLMAQAIADKYDYKMVTVSTAEIETPEPGGAERNIQKYFKDADDKTVLLFDECDSLISDRKHLGMIMAAQVNALLTCLEHYTGIVVFTTNRLGALDPAFDRRLSLKLEFEMPDAKLRKQIWLRMFPEKAPLSKDVDWDTISAVEMAGGHIKNVVLRAARRAARTTKEITEDIIAEALLEEAAANQSFTEAIQNHAPFYGTPMNKRSASVIRQRGKMSVDRG